VKFLRCNGRDTDAITHVDNVEKTFINATWIAPYSQEKIQNGISFYYTVVEDKNKFWFPQQSPMLDFLQTPSSRRTIARSGTNRYSVPVSSLLFTTIIALKLVP